jgi:hypothetical protein
MSRTVKPLNKHAATQYKACEPQNGHLSLALHRPLFCVLYEDLKRFSGLHPTCIKQQAGPVL